MYTSYTQCVPISVVCAFTSVFLRLFWFVYSNLYRSLLIVDFINFRRQAEQRQESSQTFSLFFYKLTTKRTFMAHINQFNVQLLYLRVFTFSFFLPSFYYSCFFLFPFERECKYFLVLFILCTILSSLLSLVCAFTMNATTFCIDSFHSKPIRSMDAVFFSNFLLFFFLVLFIFLFTADARVFMQKQSFLFGMVPSAQIVGNNNNKNRLCK